jgi:hypothetical protein
LCVNHAKGNFYKDLVQLAKKYKYLEPWVNKAIGYFSGCLKSAHGDTTILKSNWKNMLQHIQNKYNLCNNDTCPYKQNSEHESHHGNKPA